MTLANWDPFVAMSTDADRINRQMNRLFGRIGMDGDARAATAAGHPPINAWDDHDNIYVESELPGMNLEQMEIFVTGGDQLSIQGKRSAPALEQATWHRQERISGSFSRTLRLPVAVDADKVTAHFDNGVLLITLPKSEAAKPRRITVKAD